MTGSEIRETAKWLTITCQLFSSRLATRLAAHDLTVLQFNILQHLARLGAAGARVTDVARAVEARQPAVTKVLAKFLAMGLVAQIEDHDDRRAARHAVTDKGIAQLTQIEQSIGPDMKDLLSALPPDQQAAFTQNLRALSGWLDRNRLG